MLVEMIPRNKRTWYMVGPKVAMDVVTERTFSSLLQGNVTQSLCLLVSYISHLATLMFCICIGYRIYLFISSKY
jgi:hypothetical protein